MCAPLVLEGGVRLSVDEWERYYVRAKNRKCAPTTLASPRLVRSRRSVCVPLVLEGGVQLSVDMWGPCYVRAKNIKMRDDDT